MSSRGQPPANSVQAQAATESDAGGADLVWAYYRHLKAQRPRFFRAVAQDAIIFALHRSEGELVRTRFRRILYGLSLPFRASEYLGLVLYRLRDVLKSAHVPLLPLAISAICAVVWGIRIGDPVVMDEGIYIPHGQIVIDGLVFIGKGCELCPWITIGLRGGFGGPWLEEGVFVGTGAKILGQVRLGSGAKVGANAVVITDVPAGATAVGVPARIISPTNSATSQGSAEAVLADNEEG
jgi:serine O-acetyltransferase